jgi:hypothetical protein
MKLSEIPAGCSPLQCAHCGEWLAVFPDADWDERTIQVKEHLAICDHRNCKAQR